MASRRKKALAIPPGSPPVPPTAPWYKRTWVVAAAVGTAAFGLGMNGPTFLQNIRKLPTEFDATRDQYVSWLKEDAEWTGDWSTFPEGLVDMAGMRLSEGADLKISLQAKSGKLDGMIAVRKACEAIPFDFLLLRGSISGATSNVEVWDVVGGRQVILGQLKLVRQGNVMTVIRVGGASWIPRDATIGKHPQTDEAFMSSFCKRARQPKSPP